MQIVKQWVVKVENRYQVISFVIGGKYFLCNGNFLVEITGDRASELINS